MKISYWEPGTHKVLRGVGYQRLWWAMPVTIVEDNSEIIALYWRTGTHWKDVKEHVTASDILSDKKTILVSQIWKETDVLLLANLGESHTIWIMWEAGHKEVRCWYINLGTPLLRTKIGFDFMDQELDIVVSPDKKKWWWKDEDAFIDMEINGVFSSHEAISIRKEGEEVIRRLQAGESPFCDNWEKWTPPSEWTIPILPPGWDVV